MAIRQSEQTDYGKGPGAEAESRAESGAESGQPRRRPVAIPPTVERTYDPDRESMLAALRVVLGLPRLPMRRGPNQ